jgi:DNA-binding NtrC family response regulator
MISIQSKRVLIVEDEPVLLRSLIFTLKRLHHNVRGFSDGSYLIQEMMFSEWELPELIIIEIPLLTTTGYELIDKIRAFGIEAPIMAIISFNDHCIIKELKKRAVTTYLIKPFTMDDFTGQFDKCISPG